MTRSGRLCRSLRPPGCCSLQPLASLSFEVGAGSGSPSQGIQQTMCAAWSCSCRTANEALSGEEASLGTRRPATVPRGIPGVLGGGEPWLCGRGPKCGGRSWLTDRSARTCTRSAESREPRAESREPRDVGREVKGAERGARGQGRGARGVGRRALGVGRAKKGVGRAATGMEQEQRPTTVCPATFPWGTPPAPGLMGSPKPQAVASTRGRSTPAREGARVEAPLRTPPVPPPARRRGDA